MTDQSVPPVAERSFRIGEDDLATLEKILPQLADALMQRLDNKLRTQLRQVQRIVSDVRWSYGPAMNVKTIPAHDE